MNETKRQKSSSNASWISIFSQPQSQRERGDEPRPLRKLGKENITAERLEHLMRILPIDQRRELLKDIKLAPEWMHSIFKKLAEETT